MEYSPSSYSDNATDPAAAHKIWIDFLHERLHVLKYSEKDVINLLIQFISVFHTHMEKVRMNMASRPVFFSLMTLMFKILELLEAAGDFRVSYYRYIVYSDAFRWFTQPPVYLFL